MPAYPEIAFSCTKAFRKSTARSLMLDESGLSRPWTIANPDQVNECHAALNQVVTVM
jgi:hypothetical protein